MVLPVGKENVVKKGLQICGKIKKVVEDLKNLDPEELRKRKFLAITKLALTIFVVVAVSSLIIYALVSKFIVIAALLIAIASICIFIPGIRNFLKEKKVCTNLLYSIGKSVLDIFLDHFIINIVTVFVPSKLPKNTKGAS